MGEKENYLRIPITMPAEMVAELEVLSLKAKMSGGKKLANTEFVRAAVSVLLKSGIDIDGCKDEKEVEVRFLAMFNK
jgi:hypothetical protein